MFEHQAVKILKQQSQRITKSRVALLEFLKDSPCAFTFSEIENQLPISIDRTTIYRILQKYVSTDLVLKMVDSNGICMYMFNPHDHNTHRPHPHLRCKKCGKVCCLPSLPYEYLESLQEYKIDDIYYLMEGICPECLHRSQ
jgi:Fur family transcriptional regulator, ferric uptake regulator